MRGEHLVRLGQQSEADVLIHARGLQIELGYCPSTREIAQRVGLSQGSTARVVQRLIAAGRVQPGPPGLERCVNFLAGVPELAGRVVIVDGGTDAQVHQ